MLFDGFMQKDEKHLILAHLFDKPCFLGLLAVQVKNKFIQSNEISTYLCMYVGMNSIQ